MPSLLPSPGSQQNATWHATSKRQSAQCSTRSPQVKVASSAPHHCNFWLLLEGLQHSKQGMPQDIPRPFFCPRTLGCVGCIENTSVGHPIRTHWGLFSAMPLQAKRLGRGLKSVAWPSRQHDAAGLKSVCYLQYTYIYTYIIYKKCTPSKGTCQVHAHHYA